MKPLMVLFSTILIVSSCNQPAKPQFIQFTTYSKEVDSSTIWKGRSLVYYNFFFLVNNYSTKKENIAVLDSFANHFLNTGKFSPNREEVRLWFYKETSKTNIESIKANPREVDRYSNQHDLVWSYTLQRNNFIKIEKIKNGDVVETNVELMTPIPKFKIKEIE